jgi:Tfp pilus assembly PilM family ATPase
MAKTIICVEFGKAITRIAEASVSRNEISLENISCFATPPGEVDNGFPRLSDQLVSKLRLNIELMCAKTDLIAFSVTSTDLLYKTTKLKRTSQMEDIQDCLEMSFVELFPGVEQAKYRINYSIQRETADEYIIDVFAIPNRMINTYGDIAEMLNMKCVGLVDSTYALIQTLYPKLKYINTMLVHVDEQMLDIVLVENGNIRARKKMDNDNLYNVICSVRDTSAKKYTSDLYNATEVMINCNMIGNISDCRTIKQCTQYLPLSDEDLLINSARNWVNNIVDEIEQTVSEFYNNKEMFSIQQLIITGLGGDMHWLLQSMTHQLGIPATNFLSINDSIQMPIPKLLTSFDCAGTACVCAACPAANLLDFADENLSLSKRANEWLQQKLDQLSDRFN